MAWMCGDHYLPDGGGVFDQDYQLITRMRTFSNIYNTLDKMRNLKGNTIHQLTDGERRLIKRMREGGYI
jgi:hypothetical protein